MPADSPSQTGRDSYSEHGSSSSLLVRTTACTTAAILVLLFVVQAYWTVADAGPHFRPQLPVMAAVLTAVSTLGAAALLLTRIGVLTTRLPGWLVWGGPWLLAVFYGWLGLTHLLTADSGQWQIDLQGPLLLLLAGLCIIVASEEPADPRNDLTETPKVVECADDGADVADDADDGRRERDEPVGTT